MEVLLQGGPGHGQVVDASGPTVVWRACLYERTDGWMYEYGAERRVFQHRPDCCDLSGGGAEDRCE